jgi:lipoic acid synthetase
MVTPGKPQGVLDVLEPENVAFALSQMGLTYIVLTSVDRDDLPDGGASHFAKTIKLVKERNPDMIVEVLIPDFQGDLGDLATVVEARPDVIAHNIETTMSLTSRVRDPRAHYWQSLSVLRNIKKLSGHVYTKSSIMVGLGETEEEVTQAMTHLRRAGVDFLTVGQYLRPSQRHLKVEDYVRPAQFEKYKAIGDSMGFLYVASGPLVRSSYRAGEFFIRTALHNDGHRKQSFMSREIRNTQ